MLKKTLIASLAALLVAGPALARDGHRRHRSHHQGHSVVVYQAGHHGGNHGRHHGYRSSYSYGHGHHGRHYVAGALIAAGALAVGLTALAAHGRPPASAGWLPFEPPPLPDRANAYDLAYEDGYCREFQRDIEIGSRVQRAYGTACLQEDGSWKIVD